MLTLYHNGEEYPIQNTEYYIRELANGLDEVIFDLSIYDPIYAIMAEEENIVDRAGQTYKVKQIDAGGDSAKVVCQLDIDDWRATLNVDYNSGTKTCAQQIEAVKPAGWTVLDHSLSIIGRTIEGDYTPYDVCVRCTEVYNVYIRWDNKLKHCDIYTKVMGNPVGAFATRELNLKEINYKGKSNDLITRLYAYGQDGLSFASINSNKPYVDNNTYESRIICGIWRDERYTVAADLLADAQKKLAEMAVPSRSYDCSIVDLQATNPSLYNNLDFSLFTAATLIDDVKGTAVDYQVVERHIYPYHPEENEVIFDSSPQKITSSVASIEYEIDNPNSDFQQIQAKRISEATDWLLSGDGYVVAIQDSNGQWKELLFMDTNDISTAQDVLRINKNGIGFSTTGANGPYTNAWTIDGNLVADFITTGTLTANVMKAGILTDLAGKFSLNMATGALSMADGTFSGTITGSTISGSSISGGDINIGPNAFIVNSNGDMTAGNGNFTVLSNSGKVTAVSLYVGTTLTGLIINGNAIHSFDGGTEGPSQMTDQQSPGVLYSNTGLRVNLNWASTIIEAGAITVYSLSNNAQRSDIGEGSFNFANGTGLSIYSAFDAGSGTAMIIVVGTSYSYVYASSGYWPGSSDERTKKNIESIDRDKLKRFFGILDPATFEYIEDKTNTIHYGVIAQNMQEALEEAELDDEAIIITKPDGYLTVCQSEFHGLEFAGIKYLYEMVEAQQAEIEALKARIAALENK